MSNPLFGQLNGNIQNNQLTAFFQEVNRLKNVIADPKKEVQNLMNSGRLSQAQFNDLAQMANQLISVMPK